MYLFCIHAVRHTDSYAVGIDDKNDKEPDAPENEIGAQNDTILRCLGICCGYVWVHTDSDN